MSVKGIDWAWYSGGWDNAEGNSSGLGWTNGSGTSCIDANANQQIVDGKLRCRDKLFQYHHQPFNYFVKYAPGTGARADHLRDEADFLDAATRGRLRPVSFIKPLGEENEHPGYASEGSAATISWRWDHVSPPSIGNDKGAADVWGPGTRIPAMLISNKFERSGVDHAAHDTTSILKLIEERFGLIALSTRDATVGSLKSALDDDRHDRNGRW